MADSSARLLAAILLFPAIVIMGLALAVAS
jgi:hypothetical protein